MKKYYVRRFYEVSRIHHEPAVEAESAMEAVVLKKRPAPDGFVEIGYAVDRLRDCGDIANVLLSILKYNA